MIKYVAKLIVVRYENSTAFQTGKTEGNMTINIYDREKELYNDPIKFEAFNKTVKDLVRENLIKVKWVSYNHIVDKISFNIKDIDVFYDRGKIPKKDNMLADMLHSLKVLNSNLETLWLRKYVENLIREIETKKVIPTVLEQKGEYLLFQMVCGIDDLIRNGDNMLERIFSKKYFRNSKVFEKNMRSTVITLIKRYYPDVEDNLENEDILRLVGIEKTSNDLNIKGNLKIQLGTEVIDLSQFIYGISINKETLKEAQIIDSSATTVLSIENKANFLLESKGPINEVLFIFSAGFYSPIERNFLCKLRDFFNDNKREIKYCHSGDLDFGGFKIYAFIKKNIFHDLKPYKMDISIYKSNLEFAEELPNRRYGEKLKMLLRNDDISEHHVLIKAIIAEGKVLEQEAYLFE